MSKKRRPVKFDDDLCIYGENYYYRGTPFGLKKRVERSLGIKEGATQKDVLRAKRDFLESIERIGSAAGSTSFEAVSIKYIRDRERESENPDNLSDRTLYETKYIIKNHLGPYFNRLKIEEIDQAVFKEYCYFKKRKGLNLVNHRKVMNHFLKWCVHENYLKYRLELQIPNAAKKERRERVVLTDAEIEALISNCNEKLLLYVLMYLFMGMRNMEICKLRWDEINFEARSLWINPKSNRTRKGRAIPINSYVLSMLQGMAKNKQAGIRGNYVFPSAIEGGKRPYLNPQGGIRNPWLKALEKANLSRHITPHDLRATFEKFMHTNTNFTDTQREKMAGAKIDVQKDTYVKLQAHELRGLEESVSIPEVAKILSEKLGGNSGGNKLKKKATRNAKA